VRWADVENEDVLLHIDAPSFAFCASHFDLHQMGRAAHRKDLLKIDQTFLFCDWRMSGVGSNSCGGEPPHPQYRINPGEAFEFSITFTPQSKGI